MARLHFATPLPQSTHSDVLEWRLPGKYRQYVLTGKSRAAWHTSFLIPQLNLLLDAGLCVNKQRPKHIFLTHGHTDHTLLTTAFIKRSDPPDIFCPAEMVDVLNNYLTAKTVLNLGGLRTLDGGQLDVDEEEEEEEVEDGSSHWLHTHVTHGVRPGDVVPLRRTIDFTAEAFACDHTLPCVGYVFQLNSKKLKQEYIGRKGPELKQLRESGVEITAPQTTPVFAFLGDTTATTLAADPQWLQDGIPVVITECSFLYEEHRAQAVKTKHTIWADLEPVIRKWPRTTFILMHFSLRYSDEDIRRFFTGLDNPPSNMVLWIDGEPNSQL
ncbi:beta-lactamase-like protein [Coniella lustricola]|uniref:Beta-lactamase-like protein n=1 Tax=Coniella lustricola TaxID=2025994 RepID=A0A2T3AIK7_9PEZI|nr:beta-lactamase-like protein [Coniella lustricola]